MNVHQTYINNLEVCIEMAKNKSFFNMQMSDTQREVLDRLIDNDFPGMSVAGYISFLIRLRAHNTLGLDVERDDFNFEVLLEFFKKEQMEKEERIKLMLGEEQYNKMMEAFQKEQDEKEKRKPVML
jgi:hypothetical protein